ncbi:MAG: hypothetical protein WAQ99_20845 [Pyrinomonadaceae bacterium]
MLNLNQLARFRVHLIIGSFLLAWFSLATLMRIIDGENVLWAIWSSISEVKLMEWVTLICVWATMASLVKQNDELRAKVQLLESRQ